MTLDEMFPENSYTCECCLCKEIFIGHKDHVTCRYCDKAAMESKIAKLEKEHESLLRLISYVKSIVFSKVKCSYVSFRRPLEELLKDQSNG